MTTLTPAPAVVVDATLREVRRALEEVMRQGFGTVTVEVSEGRPRLIHVSRSHKIREERREA